MSLLQLEPPAFWDQVPPTRTARCLAPLGELVAWCGRRRFTGVPGYNLNMPVICIGNAGVGGTGKTPLARHVLQDLTDAGLQPWALTRGYGGRLRGPVKVDPQVHSFADVGDEALLLDASAPVIVARDRVSGATTAARAGAHAAVCDDGLQNHPSLRLDCALLSVPTSQPFGNGLLLPAGPLREKVSNALAKVHGVVVIGDGDVPSELRAIKQPVFRAHKVPVGGCGEALNGAPIIAFAGIGRPENFFASLQNSGGEIIAKYPFPDHAPYSRMILERLLREAEAAGAFLVTTEKDMVRIPNEYYGYITPFVIRLRFDDGHAEALHELIMQRIGTAAALAVAGRGDFLRDRS